MKEVLKEADYKKIVFIAEEIYAQGMSYHPKVKYYAHANEKHFV